MVNLHTKFLRPITAPEKVSKIYEILSWAVRYQIKPGCLEITLFKLAQWVAVPAVSEILINPMAQEQLQRTIRTRGHHELWAVPLDQGSLPAYTVPVTIEGIEEFRRYLGAFSYALFAGEAEPDWVIISIESELYVIAGSVDFVGQILNCEVEEAFSSFHNFVMHEPMPQQLKKYLHSVYDRLKDNYESAEVGAEFIVTP